MKTKKHLVLDFSLCVEIEVMLVAFILLFTILKQSALISLCFSFSFVFILVYIAMRIRWYRFDAKVLLLILLATINILVNAALSPEANLGFDYFKKLIMFATFIFHLYFSSKDKISGNAFMICLYLPFFAGIALIISYFFLGNTDLYAGGISLGFSNSNFAGMWLLHLLIYSFLVAIRQQKRKWVGAVAILASVILVWLIIETKTRSCLLAAVFFLALVLAGRLISPSKILNRIVLLFVTVFPIIFVAIYHVLLQSNWFLSMFSFLVSEGKSLGSRLSVWEPAIKALQSNFIFGDYSGISNGTGMAQMHNMHLDVICSYGIIPFCLFLWLLYHSCCSASQKSKNMKNVRSRYFNYCAICGFLSTVIMGTFEAGIVAGAMGLNILTAGLVLLANNYASAE